MMEDFFYPFVAESVRSWRPGRFVTLILDARSRMSASELSHRHSPGDWVGQRKRWSWSPGPPVLLWKNQTGNTGMAPVA